MKPALQTWIFQFFRADSRLPLFNICLCRVHERQDFRLAALAVLLVSLLGWSWMDGYLLRGICLSADVAKALDGSLILCRIFTLNCSGWEDGSGGGNMALAEVLAISCVQ
jgi:hypothetical protein